MRITRCHDLVVQVAQPDSFDDVFNNDLSCCQNDEVEYIEYAEAGYSSYSSV